MTSPKQIFNQIGAKTLYVAPSVQEAAVFSAVIYGQMALRLVG